MDKTSSKTTIKRFAPIVIGIMCVIILSIGLLVITSPSKTTEAPTVFSAKVPVNKKPDTLTPHIIDENPLPPPDSVITQASTSSELAPPTNQSQAENISRAVPPALDVSDAPFLRSLFAHTPAKSHQLIASQALIRRIVVMVDNLPNPKMASKLIPLRRPEGSFKPIEDGGRLFISPENGKRFIPYMQLLQGTDPQAIAQLYRQYFPLFQEAYAELGNPHGNFHDRVLAAIDDMLAAPDPSPPIWLMQPKVLFEFVSAELEERSAGQKLLMRLDPLQSRVVKAKLSALRLALGTTPPSTESTPQP